MTIVIGINLFIITLIDYPEKYGCTKLYLETTRKRC